MSLSTRADPDGLPPELRAAQEAVALPEVQAMIRRLSEYGLGVCMPHGHDEATGGFCALPPDTIQVEKGLRVSFQPAEEVGPAEHYLAVGWRWVGDGVAGAMVCHMKCMKRPGDSMHYQEHEAGT